MASTTSANDYLPLLARDFHILLALTDGQCHGYGLVKAIEQASEGTLRLDPANLYRALHKLTVSGLVKDAERRPAADAANERRRYYCITPLGCDVVAAEAARMRHLADVAATKRLIAGTSSNR